MQENIESSTDLLKSIINPLVELDGEIVWPPRSQQSIIDMRKVAVPDAPYIPIFFTVSTTNWYIPIQ